MTIDKDKNLSDSMPVLLCLTVSGLSLAQKIKVKSETNFEIHALARRCDKGDVFFEDTTTHIATLFLSGRPIIGLCASAILIRAVAPHLLTKFESPPVIALAEDGRHVVPLLGGHHGGHQIGRIIADIIGSDLALTTAGDQHFGISLDEPPAGFKLADRQIAKTVMARLLAGAGISVAPSRYKEMNTFLAPLPEGQDIRISVTSEAILGQEDHLVYHPAELVIGAGCARGCAPEEMIALATQMMADHKLANGAVAAICSVDIKADEPALHALAATFDCPIRVFSPSELEAQTPFISSPSETVFAEIGTHSVSEAAALAGAGTGAKLIAPKQKSAAATCAIARAKQPITCFNGHPPGRLSLVGIGPGRSDWRTGEASRIIAEADLLCGYKLYLDLLGGMIVGKNRRDFALGAEEDRCRFALEEAAKGQHVAMICSGDAGIYAMGALVFELLERKNDAGGISAAARRVQIVTCPGISAMQAAAARSGGILGHDFCAISLSDLLTPWPVIEKRIEAAGAGDFVIAFYNPVSMRRRTQLMRARDILCQHRPLQTPGYW